MPPRKPKGLTATITPADWDRIVEVYQRHGGYSKAVRDELGFPEARARRLFYRGLPSRGYPPIRTLIGMDGMLTDQIRARRVELEEDAALSAPPPEPVKTVEEAEVKAEIIHVNEQTRLAELVKLEEERRKAREDAIKSRAEEALLVSINRRNAIALNGVTSKLMRGATALSAAIQDELEQAARDKKLPLAEKLKLIRSAASVARFNSEATMLAIKSERMVLGQPIEAPVDTQDDGSLEQAVEWIETASRAVQLARKRGLLMSSNEQSEAIPPKAKRH